MNNNKKGFAMVFVLMITSLLFIFGISLLGLTLSEYRITYAYADISKAEYLAESGLYQVQYAFASKAYEIKNSITAEINNTHRNNYSTDKQWIDDRVNAANSVFNTKLNGIKASINFNQPSNIYTDGHFKVSKIDVIEDVFDSNSYHDVEHFFWVDKDVLKGNDGNDYFRFVISIETEGVYGNITRKGTSEIEFHFDKSQDNEFVRIKSWKIE